MKIIAYDMQSINLGHTVIVYWCMHLRLHHIAPTSNPYTALGRPPRSQSSWGQHGAHPGPVGPRWPPCWPMNLATRELCASGAPAVCLVYAETNEGRRFIIFVYGVYASLTVEMPFTIELPPCWANAEIAGGWFSCFIISVRNQLFCQNILLS